MRISSENGAALITALMLTVLSLIIALTLLYMVTAGTSISASQKRYRSALAAAHGGVELVTRDIVPRLLQLQPQAAGSLQEEFALVNLKIPAYGCLRGKLTHPTAAWNGCTTAQLNADPAVAPDLSFTLGAERGTESYQVAIKIVDTIPGNTDSAAPDLDAGSSVAGREEGIHPQHIPGMFNIAVQGLGGSPREKARLSLLYAY